MDSLEPTQIFAKSAHLTARLVPKLRLGTQGGKLRFEFRAMAESSAATDGNGVSRLAFQNRVWVRDLGP